MYGSEARGCRIYNRFLLIEVEYLGTLTWTRAYSVPSCLGCRALLDLSF